jgi:hypothetical protein
MAEHASSHGAVEMGATVELADHQRTYQGFVNLLKYCTAGIVVILILMAFFLA